MALHKLKCWPKYYADVISGVKTFEIRKNDRNFAVGDALRLEEWDPETKAYTGESANAQITYIFKNAFPENPVKDGYVLMGIKVWALLSYNFPRRSIIIRSDTDVKEGALIP